jgi:hypothetical protein
MLLVNAFDWFANDEADLITTYATGQRQRVAIDGVVGATEAVITSPRDAEVRAPIVDGIATFYADAVGFHRIAVPAEGAAPGDEPLVSYELAANLASSAESDIGPSTELTLGGKTLAAPDKFEVTRSERLWTALLLVMLIIIAVEWVTYHRRITF